MTDNEATVAVPVSLILRARNALKTWYPDEGGLASKLEPFIAPKPAPRRLVVVDLEDLNSAWGSDVLTGTLMSNLESAPDVMTLIEQEVDQWVMDLCPGDLEPSDAPNLKLRIRTAIEEATR